jgi:hypothetical protein
MKVRIVWLCFVLSLLPAFGETELIVNGGFESVQQDPWQSAGVGGAIGNDSGNANSGFNDMRLGGIANANLTEFQAIAIPSNAIQPTLSFFWKYNSTDPTATAELDVMIANTNGVVLTNLLSVVNQFGAATAYQEQVFDLARFAGTNIDVAFRITTINGSGLGTLFRVDDVFVTYLTTNDFPRNDYFTNRIVLTGSATNFTSTNTLATKESGEPNHANHDGGHSLWWSWTAPTNGVLMISTAGSTFDTLLGIYTGTTISNLVLVTSDNNQSDIDSSSRVKFAVTTGTQYEIAIDGNGGQSGIIGFTMNFTPDTTAPKVTISSPAAGAKVTNSTVTVTGTATDNVGLDHVEIRLENATGTNDYVVADGTNSWSAVVDGLIPGTNTVRVRAIDISGNISTTVARAFKYVIVSPLTLTVNGSGTVTPNLNGQALEIGTSFTVVAKPGIGSVFDGWSGDLSSPGVSLTFVMQSNLVLQANFVPNPFAPATGIYQGLFYDTNGVTHQSSGFFNGTVSGSGAFTAKVTIAGVSYSLSGTFTGSGIASNTIVRKGLTPVSVQLQLDLFGGGITGVLTDGSWTAELNAFRAGTAPAAARYTIAFPGSDDSAAQPGGDGYGTVTIDTAGNLTFSGVLGDGTKAAQKTFINADGQWPFYVALYSGKGSILGWLTVANGDDITGPVSWIKLAQPAKLYTAGFTNQIDVLGSNYGFVPGVPVLNLALGELALQNGNLSDNVTNGITITSDSKVMNFGLNTLKVTIATSTGVFKGSMATPANGTVKFSGVVLQKQNIGAGFFLGPTQSGRVRMEPQP